MSTAPTLLAQIVAAYDAGYTPAQIAALQGVYTPEQLALSQDPNASFTQFASPNVGADIATIYQQTATGTPLPGAPAPVLAVTARAPGAPPAAPAITPVIGAPSPAAAAPTPAAATPAPVGVGSAAPVVVAAAPVAKPRFISIGGAVGGGVSGGIGGLATGIALSGVTFGISIVVSAILGALFGGLFGGPDINKLAQAVDQLRTALAQGLDETYRFAWAIGEGLGALLDAIHDIWISFIDALWSTIKSLWKLLWCVVDTVIPAIINRLRDLRKFLDTIYVKYILPAMKYLRLVRQVLTLLRALHVPIAAKLDKILGQIQAALYLPLLSLAQVVGGYGAWINVILTNRYTLQRPVFIRTMTAYSSDWINIFWAAQLQGQGAVGLPPSAGGGVPPAQADPLAEVQQYLRTGTGPMAADVATAQAMNAAAIAGAV